jgi:hypothetical protein
MNALLTRCLGLCLLMSPAMLLAADLATPRHDPFARPVLGAASGAAGAADHAQPVWQPRLQAVVVAGPRSSVLLDGRVLEMGEEVDGYRLIQVLPDKASFRHKGRRVELTLSGRQTP